MSHTTDLGKDRIPILVLKLAIPSMIAQFVTVLYSIIDRMFIGNIPKIGDAALAGVGVCGPIVTLLTSFGTLIGLGGSILMTMRMGAGRKKQAESILAHSFALLVVFSAVLTVLFLVSKRYLLNWFGASPATFPYADSYLTIYTAGTFFCPAGHRAELFYYLPGLSGHRHDNRSYRSRYQYHSGSGFYLRSGYESCRSSHCHRYRAVCLLRLCFLFPHREENSHKDYAASEEDIFSPDCEKNYWSGNFPVSDSGYGQRDYHCTEYRSSEIRRP